MHLTSYYLLTIIGILVSLLTGCEPSRVTVSYTELSVEPPMRGGVPIVQGSIGGVSGIFLIDTGANEALLTKMAVQRCGIVDQSSGVTSLGVGGEVALTRATNVTIQIGRDLTIHWPVVFVIPRGRPDMSSNDFFGVIDFHTLEAKHAVIDTMKKTLTMDR